jgi:hypothetical protein
METPRQRYLTRLGALKRIRSPWDEQYRQLGDYLLPWRIKFDWREQGRRSNDKILDPTGTLALRTCAAGMSAGFCSPARVWFRHGPPSQLLAMDRRLAEKPTVKRYLADTEEVARDILLRSNFYGVTSGSAFYDLAGFGTFGMFADEDLRTVLRFKPLPVGQYWLAANAAGEIDTIYRHFGMTIAQLVQENGLERCSAVVKDQYRRHQYDVVHPVLHLVEPNRRDEETGFEGRRAGRWGPEGMDFRSVWMECGNESDRDVGFLRVRGYRLFPAITPRWGRTTPEDVYGTGPGHEALPDVKQLQTMKRRLLQLIEKSAIPPLKGPPDLVGGVPSQLPGAYTAVSASGGGEKLEPIYTPLPAAIEQVRAEIGDLRYAIREGLFADLWRIITDDDRAQPSTAEEVRAKREERLLQLGPVGNAVEQEYLRKVLDRTFEAADFAGLLPEPPEELAGLELKVDFLSVMSEAQRAQEIPAVERVAAFVKALAALDEEVIDKVDADKFADKYSEIAGLPPELLRSAEAVEALRQARAEKREAAETGAALGAAATGARDLAGASLENDNALARVLGGLGPVVGAQAGVTTPGAVGGIA